jgi:hypothetical protein
MRAFPTEATRLSGVVAGAARWNWSPRQSYAGLRHFALTLASRIGSVDSGLLRALQDSRSRLAARVIDEHRHLVQDYQCIGVLHCADDAGLEPRQTEFVER